mmetsp:Transcript_84835/g.220985  ORF Transcript_84835/g.220985 Transcript_84835/m.220985 type:complete len:224 (-) Transcript_84835:4-675(-)
MWRGARRSSAPLPAEQPPHRAALATRALGRARAAGGAGLDLAETEFVLAIAFAILQPQQGAAQAELLRREALPLRPVRHDLVQAQHPHLDLALALGDQIQGAGGRQDAEAEAHGRRIAPKFQRAVGAAGIAVVNAQDRAHRHAFELAVLLGAPLEVLKIPRHPHEPRLPDLPTEGKLLKPRSLEHLVQPVLHVRRLRSRSLVLGLLLQHLLLPPLLQLLPSGL